jgi:hypothetical protein
MQKTILIPIDLTVKSLNTLKYFLNRTSEERVRVVLMYAVRMSDSITDALFYNPTDIINSRTTQDFNDALAILKNRFNRILTSVDIELFHGESSRALRVFLEAHKVDEVYVASSYKLTCAKRAYDPTDLFPAAGVKVQQIGWNIAGVSTEQDLLESLLFSYN